MVGDRDFNGAFQFRRSALVKATISGYAYEEGAEYAEQVEKKSGGTELSRSPDDFEQYADEDDDE